MTSLKLLDTQRQDYLYYKHATLLKFALPFYGTQSDTVNGDKIIPHPLAK